MKQIVKVDEPSDFAEWKANDKMARRPNWNRVPAPVRKSIHESLLREQGFICCYCESWISEEDSHIEHFRPRRFQERRLDYENLHCSCQRNGEKGQPRRSARQGASDPQASNWPVCVRDPDSTLPKCGWRQLKWGLDWSALIAGFTPPGAGCGSRPSPPRAW